MDREKIMEEFLKKKKKGSKLWGALNRLLYYGAISVDDLESEPFNSKNGEEIIKVIKRFCNDNRHLGVDLVYINKQNEITKTSYREYFLKEVV